MARLSSLRQCTGSPQLTMQLPNIATMSGHSLPQSSASVDLSMQRHYKNLQPRRQPPPSILITHSLP